jgi:hypothetical protein
LSFFRADVVAVVAVAVVVGKGVLTNFGFFLLGSGVLVVVGVDINPLFFDFFLPVVPMAAAAIAIAGRGIPPCVNDVVDDVDDPSLSLPLDRDLVGVNTTVVAKVPDNPVVLAENKSRLTGIFFVMLFMIFVFVVDAVFTGVCRGAVR